LITAGPTKNRWIQAFYYQFIIGKDGLRFAIAAHRRGAKVTLISGPTTLPLPTAEKISKCVPHRKCAKQFWIIIKNRHHYPKPPLLPIIAQSIGRGKN